MQKIILVGNLGRDISASQQNAPTSGNAAGAGAPLLSASLTHDWMTDFRALVGIYEKQRWQGLNDGTESRKFVPIRMRLVKHFFDLYDSACLANDEASTAIMKSRLERLAFDPRSRWGALL